MNIEYTVKNCTVTDRLKKITKQKLDKLDKYFAGNETTAKVGLKSQANSLTTEVTLDYNGNFVRASGTSKNFYKNLDAVLPKLEAQIRKYRTRFDKHHKNVSFNDVAMFEGETETKAENKRYNVVKEKKFKLEPMTVKEAQETMELLGHSFYVFLEAKTQTIQVLYLRNDGDLGLIEPEI